jgi:hypothetical protein
MHAPASLEKNLILTFFFAWMASMNLALVVSVLALMQISMIFHL